MGLGDDFVVGLDGQLGCVVVMAEMTEKHIFQRRRVDFGYESGCIAIVKMAIVRADSGFQVVEISAVYQHLQVIIALKHKELRLAQIEVGTRGYASQVGGHTQSGGAVGDKESAVVGAIVEDFKGCEREITDFELKFLVDSAMIVLDSAGDAVAAKDAVQRFWGAV